MRVTTLSDIWTIHPAFVPDFSFLGRGRGKKNRNS
jgi:hypothetical protein